MRGTSGIRKSEQNKPDITPLSIYRRYDVPARSLHIFRPVMTFCPMLSRGSCNGSSSDDLTILGWVDEQEAACAAICNLSQTEPNYEAKIKVTGAAHRSSLVADAGAIKRIVTGQRGRGRVRGRGRMRIERERCWCHSHRSNRTCQNFTRAFFVPHVPSNMQ